MRPASNLKANTEFKLEKSALKDGFLGFYNGRTGVSGFEFAYKLVAALCYPAANKPGAPETKHLKAFAEACVRDQDRKWMVRGTLRFDNPTQSYEYRVPLVRLPVANDTVMAPPSFSLAARDHVKQEWNTQATPNLGELPVAPGRVVAGADLSTRMEVPSHTRACVATGIKHVEGELKGNAFVLWVTFRIESAEAEYLNNSAVAAIKLGNFYPVLLDWAATVMGETGNVPRTITPISQIAHNVRATLGGAGGDRIKPRVGVDGMVMDIHNTIYVIPEVDQTAEYEQKMMDFGLRENGVYTWAAASAVTDPVGDQALRLNDVTQPVNTPRLPINMPIYTDWLNDKFAYSNSAGNLAVYDLSTTVPATNFHLLKVLNTPFAAGLPGMLKIINNAVLSASRYDRGIFLEKPTQAEINAVADPVNQPRINELFARPCNDFLQVIDRAMRYHAMVIGTTVDFDGMLNGVPVPLLYQVHHIGGLETMRWVGRLLMQVQAMFEDNLEAMYRQYSVMTVLSQLAVLRVLGNHGNRHQEIHLADQADRSAFLNQGVDPNYVVDDRPLVKKDLSFMPHQAKVDNLMREHPKSAIYAVAAGGGKTIQILTNILRELKDGVCKRPLIMCPTHLVSQYIEEVVYVTEGRLNIIPLTNVSMKSYGEDGLEKLIANAPPNTVVVADYDFISRRRDELAYGNKTITIYRNAEFMRKFEFDLVALDESHYLKNVSSGRRDAAARIIQDIPYKRLASGTFVADTIVDVVSQVALVDPTIFGSPEQFKAEFADEMRGAKVLSWKPGAERLVRERIQNHVVYAEAKRKEWAALLPDTDEGFYAVDLTENQRLLYDSILAETMELINEALAKKPEMRDAMESEDDTKAEDLERMLRPYMARLERFLSAPELDPAGEIFLKLPEDQVSPKLKKAYEIIQGHINDGIPGKVLVFTQYLPTAEACYLNAPEALRNQGIHYTAAEKVQARADFEQDDAKRWMVGQSSSMDTGLNFQHVSRLIRLETVWTPGVLEQGNSRINRPQLKKVEERTTIYFDWIMVNRTVDVTKISRLIAKVISKAKFDEHDNPDYQAIEDLPPTPITLDSIAANNDFENELMPYMEAYADYERVKKEDYAAYREEHGMHTPEDILKAKVAVPQGGMLPGSKLISRVPYIPGMNLYGADKLGLIRYDQFVRQDLDTVDALDAKDEEEKEDETEEIPGDDAPPVNPRDAINKMNRELRAKERVLAKFKPVHTEYGDGEITSIGIKYIRVRLADGRRIRVHKMRAFVITRTTTNNIDMRNELLKQVGEIPIDTPISVPVEPGPAEKKRSQKETPIDTKTAISLNFSVINDMLFVVYNTEDDHDTALPILQNLGFRQAPAYKFAHMAHYRRLLRTFRKWRDAGFTIDIQTSTLFKNVYDTFKSNPASIGRFGLATNMKFENFYRAEIKPNANPQALKVYPLIQDGKLYLILPTHGQTGNLRAVRVPIENVRWRDGGGRNEYLAFVKTKEEGKDLLKKILAAGLEISNKDELKGQYEQLRMGKGKIK